MTKKLSYVIGFITAPLLISCHSGGTSNNTLNGYTYLITGTNVVQQCQVINNILNIGTCQNMSGSFDHPVSIAFNGAKTVGYIANQGNNTLSVCTLNGDKSFGACSVASTTLNTPTSMAVVGNSIYIANNMYISQCSIQNDGSLANCSNTPIANNLKSITAGGNNSLYGLTNNGATYNYTLPALNSTSIQYQQNGSSNQLSYNTTNNLLYIAAKNNIGGGGIYGCNVTNNSATCITSFSTLSIVLPLPLPAPIYALSMNNNMAYFIDYAYDYSNNSTATFLNSCSIASDGTFNSCSASKLSNNNLYDSGNLAITYLSIQ